MELVCVTARVADDTTSDIVACATSLVRHSLVSEEHRVKHCWIFVMSQSRTVAKLGASFVFSITLLMHQGHGENPLDHYRGDVSALHSPEAPWMSYIDAFLNMVIRWAIGADRTLNSVTLLRMLSGNVHVEAMMRTTPALNLATFSRQDYERMFLVQCLIFEVQVRSPRWYSTGDTIIITKYLWTLHMDPALASKILFKKLTVFGHFQLCEYNLRINFRKTWNRTTHLTYCGTYSDLNVFVPSNMDCILSYGPLKSFVMALLFDITSNAIATLAHSVDLGDPGTPGLIQQVVILRAAGHVVATYHVVVVKHCRVKWLVKQHNDVIDDVSKSHDVSKFLLFDGPELSARKMRVSITSVVCCSFQCILFHQSTIGKRVPSDALRYSAISCVHEDNATFIGPEDQKFSLKVGCLPRNFTCHKVNMFKTANHSHIKVEIKSFGFQGHHHFDCMFGGLALLTLNNSTWVQNHVFCETSHEYIATRPFHSNGTLVVAVYSYPRYSREKSPPLWGRDNEGGKASDWSRIQNPAF